MKIKKIHINNFMPYKGEQVIEFPQHETQNVMLVFGDNMRGKTSFLNAIRWVFYGVALGRHLREIPRINLINSDAIAEGAWLMSVSIHFEHQGKIYELNRKIEKRDNVTHAKNHADFKEDIGLRINGEVVFGDLINNEVNQVMPREVSRFFLFDGELLQEYENLLIEENEQGKKIKKHIESVLGVPALINARDDLKSLLKEARTVQRKDAQKNDDLKSLAQDLKNHQVKLDSLESNLQDLQSQKDDVELKIDELSDYLRNTDAVQAKKIEMERLTSERQQHEKNIANVFSSTKQLLKTAWKDVLYSSVSVIVNELRVERDGYQSQQTEAIRLQSKIDDIQSTLENNTKCNTCGQNIPESQLQPLRDKLERLKASKNTEHTNVNKLVELTKQIDNLETIRSENEVNRIIEFEDSATRSRVALTAIDNQLDELEVEIRGFDTEEIMRKREAKERYLKQAAKIEGDIDRAESAIEMNNEKQRKISQLISKVQGAKESLSTKRVERLEELETVFAQGIDQLRNKLREDVEKHASRAFKKLTSEKTYSGLQINQSYGLSILDQDGRILEERSAGAEQVVALSLIDGLNKTSGTSAPIVMDTPLGRLDLKHRSNILQYLPDMSEQVVLLVHEGELDPKRDLEQFASRIGARYNIKRVSATQSFIEKVVV